MSAFGAPKSPTSASALSKEPPRQEVYTSSSPQHSASPARDSPAPTRTRTERALSRPSSMIQAYQPPMMEIAQDTIPELQPIFSFLNSHSNKLYQEGYFLKLNDLDSRRNHPSYESVIGPTLLTYCRWTTQCGQILDRMLCAAGRNGIVLVGCNCP